MTISLAFLAPNLVKAAVEGRLPRSVSIERLRDPPTEWSRQFEALGLNRNSCSAAKGAYRFLDFRPTASSRRANSKSEEDVLKIILLATVR
jgi:hypothetical protein